ncbi:hypothetical protein [Rhizobium sp. SL86]|uniref:hypothetical protein n=1 Tax=Rhizobium sp. SL86 TaxID=2995148 RepID=UPI002274E6B6|nr:hypothetical protein [Rhizobium sp. SL86]MCY1667881.1 hypothetical protein [Rhizobium sp. SL86]
MKIHPDLPIADGICFDDTLGMDARSVNALAACGVVFLTSFRADDGRIYDGVIIAAHLDAAQAVADRRGLDETVLGPLAVAGVA